MGICERIKGNRVIYDEGVFTVTDIETIDFSNILAPGQTLTSINTTLTTTEVTTRECDLVINGTTMMLTNISFFVNKTIVANTAIRGVPDGTVTKTVSLNTPSKTITLAKPTTAIDFSPADQRRAHCQIHDVTATDIVSIASPTTVLDNLTISFIIKVSIEDQFVVQLCHVDALAVINSST